MSDKVWQWVGDYCSGSLDEAEERELRVWLDESEENKRYFMEGVKAVREYQDVKRVDMSREDFLTSTLEKVRVYEKKKVWMRYSVAASVVILFTLSFVLLFSSRVSREESPVLAKIPAGEVKAILELAGGVQVDLSRDSLKELVRYSGITVMKDGEKGLRYDSVKVGDEQPAFHSISVPVGGEYHFILADGTLVWLNSASRITFPTRFTGETREVVVDGEVYFEVEHNANKPFIVRVAEMSVRVLGTKFCVSAYADNDGIMTTLVEGTVNVTSGDNHLILKPGYQAVVDPKTGRIRQRKVELSLYTSWVKGVFEYENMRLEDIMHQLARWYDVKFDFSAEECKERRFTGVVRKYENLNEVLDVIEKTTNVKFVIQGRNVAVTSLVRSL